jgi:hypothetical protein
MKKISLIVPLCILILSALTVAETEKGADGGYAGAFLKLAVEARPAAMGGAYVAVSDDAAGQLYNPGGLASITDEAFSSSYRAMKMGRSLGFLSLVFPTRRESAMGLSWQYVGYGEVEGRGEDSDPTGKMISSSEHAFGVAFSKRFIPSLSIGMKLNYFHKEVADLSSGSIGVDLGLLLFVDSLFEYGTMEDMPVSDIRFGFASRNIAAEYLWEEAAEGLTPSQSDEFPVVVAFGASCRTLQRSLLLAVDFEKNSKQDAVFRFGGEYNMENKFFIRAGLNDGTITAGAGFMFNIQEMMLAINYAFSDEQVGEGSDHIFTIDLNL